MPLVIIAKSPQGLLVATDTQATILHPERQDPLLRINTERRVFYCKKHELVVISHLPAAFAGIFTAAIWDGFIRDLEDSSQGSISVGHVKQLFSEYLREHYPQLQAAILASLNVILHKFLPHGSETLWWKAKGEEAVVDLANNQLVQFDTEKNSQIKSNITGWDQQRIIAVARQQVLQGIGIPGNLEENVPFESWYFSDEKIFKNRKFLSHYFSDLSDLIDAHLLGDLANWDVQLIKTYTYYDLQTIAQQRFDLHQALTYKKFKEVVRCLLHMQSDADLELYFLLFQFSNDMVRDNKILRYQLNTILQAGVIILVEEALEGGYDENLARFRMHSNTISLSATALRNASYRDIVRVLSHEITHAMQFHKHKRLWQLAPYSTLETSKNFLSYSHSIPFFPYTEKRRDEFNQLLNQGLARVKEFTDLLDRAEQGEVLTAQKQQTLNSYLQAAKKFTPILFPIGFRNPDVTLRSPETHAKLKQGKLRCLVPCPNGLQAELVDFVSETEKGFLFKGFYRDPRKKIYDRALNFYIAHLAEQILEQGWEKDKEMHARIMGELHPDILRCFFPEMLAFDRAEAEAAFGPIPEYDFAEEKSLAAVAPLPPVELPSSSSSSSSISASGSMASSAAAVAAAVDAKPAVTKTIGELGKATQAFFKTRGTKPPAGKWANLDPDAVSHIRSLTFPRERSNSAQDLVAQLKQANFAAYLIDEPTKDNEPAKKCIVKVSNLSGRGT